MKGLWKIHHAVQTRDARNAYAELCAFAVAVGRADLVSAKPFTADGWGWRRLDKLSKRILDTLGADWETVLWWAQQAA